MATIPARTGPEHQPRTSLTETAQAIISASAIAHNLQWLGRKLTLANATRPSIWAVVKADAYGHGVDHVIAGLGNAEGIAVFSLGEVYKLRHLGWRKPVLVMNAARVFDDDCLNDPTLHPLHLVVDHEQQIVHLEKRTFARAPYIWLRYAGILHHAGLHSGQYVLAWRRLQALMNLGALNGVGLMQHYARAEDTDQLQEERRVFERLFGGLPGPRCTENSAALLSDPGYAGANDWVRSGIALYGISPLAGTTGPQLGLRPAMRLQAPIHSVLVLQAGQPLGYGSTFHASHDMRIGLVACGYACGYPRNLAKDCPVEIDGQQTRIVGRVSMDTLSIDLSAHPNAGPGTTVTLWGTHALPIETVAQCAATIPAQLCSGITARVHRQAR